MESLSIHLALTFINKAETTSNLNSEIKEEATPYELFECFFEEQNGRKLNIDEDNYLKKVIESLEGDE